VTWVRSFRTCERIEHKHEHEHEHEHEIRVGAQYVSHAARAKLPETNMNMNTNTRKEQGLNRYLKRYLIGPDPILAYSASVVSAKSIPEATSGPRLLSVRISHKVRFLPMGERSPVACVAGDRSSHRCARGTSCLERACSFLMHVNASS